MKAPFWYLITLRWANGSLSVTGTDLTFPPRKQEYKLKEAEFGPKTYGVRSQFLTAKFSFQLSVDEARWHIGKLIFVQWGFLDVKIILELLLADVA